MAIFVSSKIVKSSFNVKKSVGPDVFNIAEGSKAVNIVGKKLDGDVVTLTGKAADYAIIASGDAVTLRSVNELGKFVTVKFSIKDLGSVTLAFADGGFEVENLLGKGHIAIGGELVGKRYLSVDNYLDLDGAGSDGGAFLDPALSKPELDHINLNPVFSSASTITVNEDQEFTSQLAATDTDGNELTYSLVTGATNGSVDLEGAAYTYAPNEDFNGSDSFVVSVSDGKGGVVQQTITVTVKPVNDAPEATADIAPVTEGSAVIANTVATNDSDVDGDVLTYALAPTQAPVPGLTFSSDGSYLFDPSNAAYQSLAAGEPLPVVVHYTVTDGKSAAVPSTLTIILTGTNDLPAFTSASTLTVTEDNEFSGQLVATDIDGDDLEFALDTEPGKGVAEVNADGSYTYTPNANFSGSDSFVVSVSDGVATVKQTITVTVNEGDLAYSLTSGVDILTGLGVRNTFQETAPGQFSQDDIISGGQFEGGANDTSSDDTLLLRSSTVTDAQFSHTTGIERLVLNSDNGLGDDVVTLGKQASNAGINYVETRGGDDVIDVSDFGKADIVVDAGTGSDTLVLSGDFGSPVTVNLNLSTSSINEYTTIIGFENVDASAYEGSDLTITANDAGSVIVGSAQADLINGGLGNDDITGDVSDFIDAGAGDDTVRINVTEPPVSPGSLNGGEGEDTLVLSGEPSVILPAVFELALGSEFLPGVENLDASGLIGVGIDVTANEAGSKIKGTAQADIITGGDGNDVIRGGQGADEVDGGAGVNTFVYVGSLDAAANTLYQSFTGEVVVDESVTLDVSSVVSLADLTALKPFSDVVAGETLTSTPEDYVVIFGDVDLTLVNGGGPILGTIVVNSTLRISYNQIIENQTFIIGGLIDQGQTPSKIIITDLPVGDGMTDVDPAILDFLNLAGVETLVLEGKDGQSLEYTSIALPEGYEGTVAVRVNGVETPAVPGEDFMLPKPVESVGDFVFVTNTGDFLLDIEVSKDFITADEVADNTSITTVRIRNLGDDEAGDDDVSFAHAITLAVQNNVTTLELFNGDEESSDLEANFTLTRVNDTTDNTLTIKTSAPYDTEDGHYDVEGDLKLNDEELITIDTGLAVNDYTSDLEIGDLYAESLQQLTLKGGGDIDIEYLHLGTSDRTVIIDATQVTGDIDISIADDDGDASITFTSATAGAGRIQIEATINSDSIVVTSDDNENSIYGRDGNDTITFTGDGTYNRISAGGGDDIVTVTANKNDFVDPGDTQNSIYGGDGDDTITVMGSVSTTTTTSTLGGPASAYISGDRGADTITGDMGETIYGYSSGDSHAIELEFDVINGFSAGDKFSFFDEITYSQVNISSLDQVTYGSSELALLTEIQASNGFTTSDDATLYTIGNDSYLFVDANGDGKVNMLTDISSPDYDSNDVFIKLVGVTSLTIDNFENNQN